MPKTKPKIGVLNANARDSIHENILYVFISMYLYWKLIMTFFNKVP